MKNKLLRIIIFLTLISMLFRVVPMSSVAYEHEEHVDLATEAVTEGIVLLRNKNEALPLKKSEKIAVFGGGQVYTASTTSGYQIGGGGSGWVNVSGTPMGPVDALLMAAKKGKIGVYEPLANAYKNNVNYVPDTAMYNGAAEYADTAIMFITRYSTEGSDISTSDWSLTSAELTMMKTLSGKFEKLIVMLNTPSVIGIDWSLEGNSYGVDVDALLSCYMGGESGAAGMAKILLGEANPSGKLVHTYAKSLNDYPTTNTFLENTAYVNYTEDIYVGYRYFETFAKNKVAYPFGFGLSYTDFNISADSFAVDGENVNLTVTVKNTGKVAGKEVVQIYFSAPQAGTGSAVISKSAIELANYGKTKLLAPNESQTMKFTFPISQMASFDDTGKTGNKSCYVLEAGVYNVYVGNSVRDLTLAGKHTESSTVVTSRHTQLLPTNLANRLTYNGTYETLPAAQVKAKDPIAVSPDRFTWIEAELGTPAEGSGINTTESFGSSGYIQNGSKWEKLDGGTVLGNINGKGGKTIKYKLNVQKAGTYNMGFVIANGTDKTGTGGKLLDAENVFDIYVSRTDNLGTKQPVSVDIENTRNVGTGSYWFNFKFKTEDSGGQKYTVGLPQGEIILTLYITDTANTGVTPNIDKFVLIPTGKTCTVADAMANYAGTDIDGSVDINKDNYKGITYADVAAGKATIKELIAQMSYTELIGLCYGHTSGLAGGTGSIGFASNATAAKYGIYSADTADGPAGLRLSAKGSVSTFWPCATLQASSWNVELLLWIGKAVGEECLKYNADIWLAPGLNIHRNPLCGRNFEYYSEDPLIAGRSTAAVVNGVESCGVGCAIKHFAANDKEGNRKNSDSRVSERALREIYLRGFEIAVEEADPHCIMTSYNLINGTHTSANSDLIRGILRGEWGYDGLVMTDWNTTPAITREIIAGNNVTMPTGEPAELEKSAKQGIISRDVLEENAEYIIKTLVQLPDHTVHLPTTHEISDSSKTILNVEGYSTKAYMTKFEIAEGGFCAGYTEYADEIDGSLGFVEFTVSVKTAGKYTIYLDYATTATANSGYTILVNGEQAKSLNRNLASTGSWTTFADKRVGEITLEEGISTVRIQHTSSQGVNYRSLSFILSELAHHQHSFGAWTELDGEQHERTCMCGETEKADHKWKTKGEVKVEPTEESDGVMSYKCYHCSAEKTEPIPALGGSADSNTDESLPNDTDADKGNAGTAIAISVSTIAAIAVVVAAAVIVVILKRKKHNA